MAEDTVYEANIAAFLLDAADGDTSEDTWYVLTKHGHEYDPPWDRARVEQLVQRIRDEPDIRRQVQERSALFQAEAAVEDGEPSG